MPNFASDEEQALQNGVTTATVGFIGTVFLCSKTGSIIYYGFAQIVDIASYVHLSSQAVQISLCCCHAYLCLL